MATRLIRTTALVGLGALFTLAAGYWATVGTSFATGFGTGESTESLEVLAPGSTATFAAGCFWGVEHAFRNIEGVTETSVGYTGGHVESPTYRQVCSDRTGHAEAVLVQFDPEEVSYDELLDEFWRIHDPTQRDRQGPDIGAQYRSAIYYHTLEQAEVARAALERAQEGRERQIATRVEPAQTFWSAEEYHQRYYEKSGRPTCFIGR